MSIVINNIVFFTIKEIANLLKISVPTVRAYIQAGKLRGQRIGRPILISEQSFKDFLQGRYQKEIDKEHQK